MSLDISYRLFFPLTSASIVLDGLSNILLADGEHAVRIAAPDGRVVVIPAADPRPGNPKQAEVVGFDSSPSFVALLSYTVRKKKRTSKPRINKWGEEEFFKVIKTTDFRAANVSIDCGRDYFEVNFANLSNDFGFFESTAVFSKLAELYEEGRGVVAARLEMLENWRAFAPLGDDDPAEEIQLPDGFDEGEAGIDGLVEALIGRLGGGSTR